MKLANVLTLILFAAIPLNMVAQTGSNAQTTGQNTSGSNSQSARPFPTTNYYRSPYARPPGYRPGDYARQAYMRQMQQEEEKRHPGRSHAEQTTQGQVGQQTQQSRRAEQGRQIQSAVQTYLGVTPKGDTSKGYTYQDTVSIDGMTRTFQCHLPPGYKSLRNMPVVLVFHGLQLNGSMMMFLSQFNPVADRNNFAVIYGDGIGKAWDDGHAGRGIDDIGYVGKVIDKIANTVSVDRKRVYACGISNGGYFSQMLACAIPDKIAAIGVVGSTLMQQAANGCHSNRPMPIMFFLGTSDPLIAWGSSGASTANGELNELVDLVGAGKFGGVESALARYGGIMPVPEMIEFWTTHNQCGSARPYISNEPDRDPKDGTRVRREAYGSAGREVILYRIENGGHTWPGGLPYASSGLAGKISQDINASETLWQFFKTHSR